MDLFQWFIFDLFLLWCSREYHVISFLTLSNAQLRFEKFHRLTPAHPMNTTDRRRLLGPSDAKLPEFMDLGVPTKAPSKNNHDIRPMFLKTGLVGNANGSAYLEIGDTIVEVSVFGPRPIRGSFIHRASFSVECKFLPYISQPNEAMYSDKPTTFNNNGKPGLTSVEHRISSYLETALLPSILLEKFPKSTIDIFATVVSTASSSSAKSNLSSLHLCTWLTNCAALALVDAGIECRDIVTSGQVRLNIASNTLIMDPIQGSQDEEESGVDAVVSFMNMNNDEIVGLWIEGDDHEIDEEVLQRLVEGSKQMSTKIRGNFNSYLMNL